MKSQERITTIEMEECLARYFNYRKNVIVPNVSWGFYIHECDLLVMTKAGYLSEVEIKISKADLKKDQNKNHQHNDSHNRIKELWFAIPEYLQDSIDLIPGRAGVIIVSKYWAKSYYWQGEKLITTARTLRQAKVNHKAEKLYGNEKFILARLGALRIWSLKKKLIENRNKKAKKIKKDQQQLVLQYS